MFKASLFLILLLAAVSGPVYAQNQSQLSADFHQELHDLGPCNLFSQFSFGSMGSCAEELFTGYPMHIAVGSLAPENGFGAGLAFLKEWHPQTGTARISLDADAVASNNESWRAGMYLTAALLSNELPHPATKPSGNRSGLRPVFNAYAQAISLNEIGFFGLGPDSTAADKSFFGMRETIVGVNAIVPIFTQLPTTHLAIFAETNGRFVDIRGSHGLSSPSIEQIFAPAAVPGLTGQPAFVQFGEGIRLQQTLFRDYLNLDYQVTYQQFVAPGGSQFNFQRFTADLSHQIHLYTIHLGSSGAAQGKERPVLGPKLLSNTSLAPANGPDNCSAGSDHACPKVKESITRNLVGSLGIRMLVTESFTRIGESVPFYFQPTLGGSDINGNPALPSYQDYRFRAPNFLLLQGTFDQSLYGPIGLSLEVDEASVALTSGDLGFAHLLHSYAAGLSIRAGGLPQFRLMYAWGGHEGNHTIALLNTSLLGGAARPSLF